MSDPYLAEIRIFGFNFPPRGYAQCDGQVLPINQNQSLYSLLGTTYGGDGRTTFALPDLRGRTPIHRGSNQTTGSIDHGLGEKNGSEQVSLTADETPEHSHGLRGSDGSPPSGNAAGSLFAPGGGGRAAVLPYAPPNSPTALAPSTVQQAGGSGHNNLQPYLTISFCIALQGTFPSRS